MSNSLVLAPAPRSEAAERVRVEVREFLAGELAAGSFAPHVDTWLSGVDPGFSRKLGERGWLGMTWPKRYGGHERSAMERYAVTEELLAAASASGTSDPDELCNLLLGELTGEHRADDIALLVLTRLP